MAIRNTEPDEAADAETSGPTDTEGDCSGLVRCRSGQSRGMVTPSDLAGLRRRSCTLEEFAREHRYPVGAVTCTESGGTIVFAAAVNFSGQIQRYEQAVGQSSANGPVDATALRQLLERLATDAQIAGAAAEVWVATPAARKVLRLQRGSEDHDGADRWEEWVHIHAKPAFTSARQLAEDAAQHAQAFIDGRVDVRGMRRDRKRQRPDRTVEVATDASIALRGGRDAAIAYVSEFGDWSSKIIRTSNICLAELAAVELAIACTPSTRAMRIRTDSQFVAELLNDPARPAPQRYRKPRTKIMAAMKTRQIQVVWVRGHSGDQLNDAADRIAVLTRRAHEGGFDPQPIGDRIAAEAARAAAATAAA